MRKVLLVASLWALLCAVPLPTMAGTYVNVSIGLPPPVVFARPPELVVLPGSYVYVAPDVAEDIYFHNGWWWRPWGGHWYRSRQYNSGWTYYRNVPAFYRGIPPGWRNDYRANQWQGHPWAHHRIPHHQLHQNWRGWEKNRHWERQQHWGVPGMRPQSQSHPPSREMQSQQYRSHQSKEVRSGQPKYHGKHDRGQEVQQQGSPRYQYGSPQGGGEEQQGRR
jgi:hypothetical protein